MATAQISAPPVTSEASIAPQTIKYLCNEIWRVLCINYIERFIAKFQSFRSGVVWMEYVFWVRWWCWRSGVSLWLRGWMMMIAVAVGIYTHERRAHLYDNAVL